MSDETANTGSRRKRGGGSGPLILAFLLLSLLAAGGGGFYAWTQGLLDPYLGGAEGEAEEVPEIAVLYDLPELIIQIRSPIEQPRYLRVLIRLHLNRSRDVDAIEREMPVIVDEVQTVMRQIQVEDLRDRVVIDRLRKYLLVRITERLHQADAFIEMRDILFQEMLLQ